MAPITTQIRGNAALFASSLRLRPASGRTMDSGNRNQGRLALWTPVLFSAGIGGYFTLPVEPSLWWGIAALLASGLGAFSLHRRRGSAFFAMLVSLIIAAGFTTVQVRNAAVMAPVLERKIGPVAVSGRVIRVEPSEKGYRLTLDQIAIDRLGPDQIPGRLRISVRSQRGPPNPGDNVSGRAILQPPPSPSLPGGYDFAQNA
jgi:competence protein ComEC